MYRREDRKLKNFYLPFTTMYSLNFWKFVWFGLKKSFSPYFFQQLSPSQFLSIQQNYRIPLFLFAWLYQDVHNSNIYIYHPTSSNIKIHISWKTWRKIVFDCIWDWVCVVKNTKMRWKRKMQKFQGQGQQREHSHMMKGILEILVAPAGQGPYETPYHTEDPPAKHLAEDITYGSNRALGH